MGSLQAILANEDLRRALIRSRWLLAVLLFVPLAVYMQPRLVPVGFAVSMFGQLIQSWCFASLVKNRELTARGPYVLVRNPMYLGRYFLMLGFVILLGSVLAAAAFTVAYYVYMVSRVGREERRLQRVFGEAYAAYCREVRRFLPSLGRLGREEVRYFDSSTFRENHGGWNIVLTLAAFAGLLAVRWGLDRWY